ncbi:MAG: TolC family protein [Bdellovibrionales bacterium]|nr:TolC family protein [Bdellovibrionales bacterium]
MSPAKKSVCSTLLVVFSLQIANAQEVPCGSVENLVDALACVRANEPAFRNAMDGAREAAELENSAYRLINPELSLDYVSGNSLGDVQREANASLLFTLELGGKRSARARSLGAEGLLLRADAFDQRITTLSELGGAILRLHQLQSEKAVLEEALSTFNKIIRLYRSRSQLPPEQKVSLNAFELITLDYSRRILEADAELVQVRNRTAQLFGPETQGEPLDIREFAFDLNVASRSLEDWIEKTPEMLRLRAEQGKAEGDLALARSEMWPDVKVGPSIKQVTNGPFSYNMAGLAVSFPIPILSWNGALRTSRETTEKRVQAKVRWEAQDIRSQYTAKLAQLDRILKLLKESPKESDIQKKHQGTESLFGRGLVSGALIIETHRSLVDYYQTKHSLERQFLEDALKIQALTNSGGKS